MNTSSNALPYIQNLLDDPTISEIMLDGWQRVYVRKEGSLVDVPTPFQSDEDIRALLHAIAKSAGIVIDETQPLVSFRLPDTTHVEVVLPPISLMGPAMTILKSPSREITLDDLLAWGSITPKAVDYLKACIQARLNIAVTGGYSSGKTQLMHIMSHWIPLDERILFLQDNGKPNLPHTHLVVLETHPPDLNGKNGVSMRELVRTAMRMRPDRLIVAEANGAEILDLLYAMNTGYNGSLFSIHANGPRDACQRIERMAGLGNPELPLLALREQVTSAIDIIVTLERMRDGSRKITYITEVAPMENGAISLMDIFVFNQTGFDANNRVKGSLIPTGIIPKHLVAVENAGIHVPISMFTVGQA